MTDLERKRLEFARELLCPFRAYAHSLYGRGYVKHWKANGILVTKAQMFDVMNGERLNKYVHNCLEMEGFGSGACDLIAEWIENKFQECE